MHYQQFVDDVWEYYLRSARDLPWRTSGANGLFDPYAILVSEVMLQQTQVARVIPKYQAFLEQFPTVQKLASAPLGDVLRAWQGLGYNRRAKFLWQAAQAVITEYNGTFPVEQKELTCLPGVGTNTAGAICAYAYDQPVVFIETNIRTVFIYHYFTDHDGVHDSELLPYIQQSLAEAIEQGIAPREWYWALMDYGTYLKATIGNISRSSKHYAKQSTFAGSKRQIRGQVLRLLTTARLSRNHLRSSITDERLDEVLSDLAKEGLITKRANLYQLA